MLRRMPPRHQGEGHVVDIQRSKRALTSIAAAGAMLGLSLVGSATPVAMSAGAASATGSDCLAAAHSADRQMGGGDGTDPNSVTAAEAAAMEQELQAGMQGLQVQALARGKKHHHHHHHIHLPKFVKINTYVHVITAADGTGDVTDAQIRAQMRVLNDGFDGRTSATAADTPFFFKLASVDRTANDDWYDWADPDVDPSDDVDAKTALHQGGWADLNIYIAALGDGLLGYSDFPGGDRLLTLDGLVLLNDSLPGGSAAPYNEGDTATHEIGHWLDLFHTFENGCQFPGDEIADTPYQADGDNIFECDEALDTCVQPGADPVHNFMSYGDDPCLDSFTKGQSLRMTYAWLIFRKGR
jgi:hypothetical protein